jgi:hypothetical protein
VEKLLTVLQRVLMKVRPLELLPVQPVKQEKASRYHSGNCR